MMYLCNLGMALDGFGRLTLFSPEHKFQLPVGSPKIFDRYTFHHSKEFEHETRL